MQCFLQQLRTAQQAGSADEIADASWLRELRLARQLLKAGGFGSVAAVADAVGVCQPQVFRDALYRVLWPPPGRLPHARVS